MYTYYAMNLTIKFLTILLFHLISWLIVNKMLLLIAKIYYRILYKYSSTAPSHQGKK